MAYQTFALKYRPRTFDEIVGQDHVATTLRNAVAGGRVAHGYLFAGPRGTGKTSTARVLAKALACERGPTPEPCCECAMCLAIDSGRALDLIEIDAASNRGIDEIRSLREGVAYAPTNARIKFYILDEAHMLTDAASNAFLKTLEEPPEFVYFVLCTTEPHAIIGTIRSRCQTFEFRPIAPALMVEALREIATREGVEVEDEALGAIARAANGAMRDAESIFDQAIAFARGPVTLEIVNTMLGVTDADLLASFADAIAGGDIRAVFEAVDTIVASGRDIGQLLEDLGLYFRDLLRLSLGVNPPRWMQAPAAGRERMQAQAAAIGARRLAEIIEALGDAGQRLKETAQQSLLLEVTLAHLASATEGAPAAAAPQAAPEKPAPEPAPQAAAPQPAPEPEPPAQGGPPAQEEAVAAQADDLPIELPEGGLTVDVVREHWQTLCRRLEQTEQFSVLAMVRKAWAAALEADALTLEFPPDYPWTRDRVEEGYLGRLRDALEAVFGTRLDVRCALPKRADEPPAAQEPPPAAEEPAPVADAPAPAAEPPVAEEPEPAPEPAPDEGAAGPASSDEQERLIEELKLNFDGTEQ